jgi:hypothetical protein
MLAPPASDDEDFHSRRLTRLGGRAGDVKPGKAISDRRFEIADFKPPGRGWCIDANVAVRTKDRQSSVFRQSQFVFGRWYDAAKNLKSSIINLKSPI